MQEPVRIFTAGHVDDGKSTLIGRLLFDNHSLFDDQLSALEKSSSNGALDFSLLTDGLKAERDQGITIDVAYRYFSTQNRKFIFADSPGHEQYTRNMATAASNADVLLLLIDARKEIATQAKRHSIIASLLGIRHFVIAINKMDLVGYSQAVFETLKQQYLTFATSLPLKTIQFIPISALKGDFVVNKSDFMPWYEHETLLKLLEKSQVSPLSNDAPWRLPIQCVLRHENRRFYAGGLSAGCMKRKELAISFPSRHTIEIESIIHLGKEVAKAHHPQSIAVSLNKEIDLSRGALLSSSARTPQIGSEITAQLIWMDDFVRATIGASYLLMHTTQTVVAKIDCIVSELHVDTLQSASINELIANQIGIVQLSLQKPIFYDAYSEIKATGSFLLIDPETNRTLCAGMILS